VEQIEALREAGRGGKRAYPFGILARTGLPGRLHAVRTLPAGDADPALRWSHIEGDFCRQLPKTERISTSRIGTREHGILQRRSWAHPVRGENDLVRHVDDLRYNPVQHG
jgi:putative transposase